MRLAIAGISAPPSKISRSGNELSSVPLEQKEHQPQDCKIQVIPDSECCRKAQFGQRSE